MRAVDVGVQRRELVVERVADEALRREMVAFVGCHLGDHLIYACEALERSGMQRHLAANGVQAHQPMLRILQGHTPDGAVDFVAL